MIRVAVTGGRDVTPDLDALRRFLSELPEAVEIRVGDCPTGVDSAVRLWGRARDFTVLEFTADWLAYGRKAGPIRNKYMLTNADVLVAFPGGAGTNDCVAQAKRLGLEVVHLSAKGVA